MMKISHLQPPHVVDVGGDRGEEVVAGDLDVQKHARMPGG
jgi:hypothetical protein